MIDADASSIEPVATWKLAVDEFQKMEANVRKLFTVTRAHDHPSAEPTYTFVPVWTINPTLFSVVSRQVREICDDFKRIQPGFSR